ncbi:MFS transporter [Actinokineospora auranticolor]|uniref:MFS transporter n=1 Tax=Actinokineospora auranticolor TaxID=155976 RepID=A0A2S6H150_9PSEU|nr:MFS transporter [Actinokineospora auranticolor]PPK71193.1 MFS transporter [Actinokineospora auranticolor]
MARSGGRLARAATSWLPPGRPMRMLLGVSFVDSLGTGLFLTGSALFFTRSLGLTADQVGLGLSLAGIAGFACSVLVGRLADRIGAHRALVGLQWWRGACFAAYPFADNLTLFLIVAILGGTGEWAAPPVVQSFVGSLVEAESRVRSMSALMLVRNVGFTAGAAAAAWAIAAGGAGVYTTLVFLDAASFLVSGVLLLRVRTHVPVPTRTESALEVKVRPNARYLFLACLNGLLYLHAVLLTVALPLWVADYTKAPGALIGAIVVLNTVLAVGLQMRFSRGVDGARPAAVRQARAGAALAACCLLVAATGSTSAWVTAGLVLAATAALTVGEVYQAVGAWGLSYALSPEDRRGYFLSIYNLGQTGAMIAGPWVITTAVLPAGAAGWGALAAVLAGAGALVVVLERARPKDLGGEPGAGTAAGGRGRDGEAVPGGRAAAGRGGARDRDGGPGGGADG